MSSIQTQIVGKRFFTDINVLSRGMIYSDIGCSCTHYGKIQLKLFSNICICGLCETALNFIQHISTDLEMFAIHGKRSTINYNDIKLFIRRNGVILQYVSKEYLSFKQPKNS